MKYNNIKAQREICNKIVSEHKLIKVEAGEILYNFRCQYNSVHFAKKNKDKKIAMCVYIDNGYPIIHFINYRKGVFTDNTLGEWSKLHNYYFIRWIYDSEMWQVDDIFSAYRKELRKSLSWWVRLTSDFDA